MPGPAKGKGGRPRKPGGSKLKTGENAGYVKKTVGPKGKGTQKYAHRVATGAGKGNKEAGTVVHHKDGNKSNNSSANLERTTRKSHPTKHSKGK